MANTGTQTTLTDSLNSLNKVRYSGMDFDTAFDDIKARAQQKYDADFNDFALSELGVMLIDLVSVAVDNLSFYLDRRATDTYLATARTRKSVSRLARQLGYKIKGGVPSSVDITVSLTKAQAFAVTIPSGFKFKDGNGNTFESVQAVTFDIGDGINDTQFIPCFQGTTLSESFTSTGLPNQIFELTRIPTGQFLSFGSVTVLVNGSALTENDFLTYEDTDQFETGYTDTPATIRFGDGISGNIPTKGATIAVTYVATKGKSGLVPAGAITSVVTQLFAGGTTIPLTIINDEPSSGGDDEESLDHVKAFAGRVFKSRNVAVTESDYESLAGAYADPLFGRVSVAKAISSKSAATDIELQNQLTEIQDAVANTVPNITTNLTNINTELNTVDSTLTTISTTKSSIDTSLETCADSVTSLITQERANKNGASEISLLGTDITTDCTTLLNTISAMTVGTTDTLSSATKTTLLNLLSNINVNSSILTTTANTTLSGVTSSLLVLNNIADVITDTQTESATIDTNLTTITTTLGATTSTVTTDVRGNLAAITTNLTNQTNTVNTAIAAITLHVDSFLTTDCSANLITVPILSLDNSGFYTAPSIGLIRSLQSFLDARKEVSQVVQVTSGASFLIPAVITVRLGIFPGVSESIASATVNAVIQSVLRNRKFGDSLYVSDLVCRVEDLPGVSFNNISINGFINGSLTDSSKNDINGNLIINDNEIITKGSITINVEVIS